MPYIITVYSAEIRNNFIEKVCSLSKVCIYLLNINHLTELGYTIIAQISFVPYRIHGIITATYLS